MFTPLAFLFLFTTVLFSNADALCGSNIRWSHHFNMEDVYGIWYGVGYAQHTPDMTNKPNEIGCVSLYITDATTEVKDDWRDWSIHRKNYSDQNWRSYKSNPWSGTAMSGSWLDVRLKRKVKRDIYNERKLRVVWDEDGQTMEQNYIYSPEAPGLWTVEQWRPMEKEMRARGIDIWYPDDPPRHPEVIRVLNVTSQMLIINHCSEVGDGGVFSLILRRSPETVDRWEWYEFQRQFYKFDLPTVQRHAAVCGACVQVASITYVLLVIAVLKFL